MCTNTPPRDNPDAPLLPSNLQLNGVGQWTADMYSMFNAGRPDVLPVGDLGVRKVRGNPLGVGVPLLFWGGGGVRRARVRPLLIEPCRHELL